MHTHTHIKPNISWQMASDKQKITKPSRFNSTFLHHHPKRGGWIKILPTLKWINQKERKAVGPRKRKLIFIHKNFSPVWKESLLPPSLFQVLGQFLWMNDAGKKKDSRLLALTLTTSAPGLPPPRQVMILHNNNTCCERSTHTRNTSGVISRARKWTDP